MVASDGFTDAGVSDPPTGPVPRATPASSPVSAAVYRPGAALVGGRYRLLACHGARPLLEFWEAFDALTGQRAALTLVDPRGELPVELVNEILSLTVRLRGVDTSGIASIRDVLHTGRFGIVAAEWLPGGSLRQVADTHPSPLGAATALESLAGAAEVAHRAGLHLSVDGPDRVRVTADGRAVLAFPASLPSATIGADLRGVGGCLYALLAGRWPQQWSAPDWAEVDRDPAGQPIGLATLRDDVPYLISATAAGLVQEPPGISSAATLLTMLRQATADPATAHADIRVLAPLDPPPRGAYAGFRNFGPAEQAHTARRAVLRTSIGAAAAIIAVGVALLGSGLNDLLKAPEESAALDADQLGLQDERTAPPPPAPPATVKAGAAAAPVKPVRAEIFSTDGRPDNPEGAGKVIDGDTATAWTTDTYFDADPFPAFKEGLGMMLQLPAPTTLASISVDLPSDGTVVQVRSAAGATPGALADTAELSAPTPLKPGTNTVELTSAAPVSHVLVWVSKLGNTSGKHQLAVSEITLHPPAPPT